MILEITHEGNGIFKVYPPLLDPDAKKMIEAMKNFEEEQAEDPDGSLQDRIDELEEKISAAVRALD